VRLIARSLLRGAAQRPAVWVMASVAGATDAGCWVAVQPGRCTVRRAKSGRLGAQAEAEQLAGTREARGAENNPIIGRATVALPAITGRITTRLQHALQACTAPSARVAAHAPSPVVPGWASPAAAADRPAGWPPRPILDRQVDAHPADGDMAWAASPMHSSPSRCHLCNRFSRTSRNLTSSNAASSCTPVGELRADPGHVLRNA